MIDLLNAAPGGLFYAHIIQADGKPLMFLVTPREQEGVELRERQSIGLCPATRPRRSRRRRRWPAASACAATAGAMRWSGTTRSTCRSPAPGREISAFAPRRGCSSTGRPPSGPGSPSHSLQTSSPSTPRSGATIEPAIVRQAEGQPLSLGPPPRRPPRGGGGPAHRVLPRRPHRPLRRFLLHRRIHRLVPAPHGRSEPGHVRDDLSHAGQPRLCERRGADGHQHHRPGHDQPLGHAAPHPERVVQHRHVQELISRSNRGRRPSRCWCRKAATAPWAPRPTRRRK